MAFGLSGSLSACFMYIFALSCVSTEWQIKMLACLLAKRQDREPVWFSRLVRHPARKRSGSILTTPEPARGVSDGQLIT